MSFLFPLYLFGLFAVGLPIAFHLLRKTPRGRQTFSSLLFLTPSPPRLTRRSKLDHLLLLALRALALILIAMAFARPFQRLAAMLDMSSAAGHRYVVLVDTSASMQREGLWDAAKKTASEQLSALRKQDQVAMIAFDSSPRILTSFAEGERAASREAVGKTAAIESLKKLSPTWRRTDIGSALSTAADLLAAAKDENRTDERLEIVLISDMQEGAAVDALQAFEWPPGVSLTVRSVVPKRMGNAAARVLPTEKSADPADARIRVTNAADTDIDRFTLTWENEQGPVGEPIDVYAPAGESRVIQARRPLEQQADRIRLSGDGVPYDNVYYTAAPMKRTLNVLYVGSDEPKDIKGLRYYLESAVADSPTRVVKYQTQELDKPLVLANANFDAIFVAAALTDAQLDSLQKYLAAGGRVVVALPKGVDAAFVAKLLGQVDAKIESVTEKDYAMLGRVDFQHPLFAAFSDPRFNDFTKIRFWERRRVEADFEQEDLKVLARFDEGDPALVERQFDEGRLYLLATSWRPAESQLALSTKFVPLMSWLLDPRETQVVSPLVEVGDTVPAPANISTGEEPQIRTPDGNLLALDENGRFTGTEEPGAYAFVSADDSKDTGARFMVNAPASESATSPMDPGVLESLGVQLGRSESIRAKLERERQMRDIELESQQVYWRWFLAAGLLLLIAESAVAGWQSRPEPEGMTT